MDFVRVYDNGVRFSTRLLAAFLLHNDDPARPPHARIGFTVPKAIGKAVIRNRVRRRTREAIRLHYAEIAPRWDIVVHPRRNVLDASFEELLADVRRLVAKVRESK